MSLAGWGRMSPRARLAWVLQATAALALVQVGLQTFQDRYRLGIDPQAETSLTDAAGRPARLYLVELQRREVGRGDLVAVRPPARARQLLREAGIGFPSPMLPGRLFAKRVAAVAGDTVAVRPEGVWVNGRQVAGPLVLAGTLRKPPEAFARTYRLGAGELFLLGSSPASFDSRYWGPVGREAVIGRVRVLWYGAPRRE